MLHTVNNTSEKRTLPSLTRKNDRPVGYLRAKLFNRSIITKVLVDSGNLHSDLISEEFAKILHLPILGQAKTVGTASNQGTVTILGQTRPFKLFLEGIKTPVTVRPHVVRDLAHPLNLGQSFLRAHRADLTFREAGIQLRIGDSTTMLQPSNLDLTRTSIDTRLQIVLDRFADQGSNPYSSQADILDLRINGVAEMTEPDPEPDPLPGLFMKEGKKAISFDNIKTAVHNVEKTLLKAGETTIVKMSRGRHTGLANMPSKQSNDIYLHPKMDNRWLNDRELFVQPGVHHRRGNTFNAQVTNLSKKDIYLPKACHVGHIYEAMEHHTINHLNHKPMSELTEAEIDSRRAYIIEQLHLEDNDVLAKNEEDKEAIIKIFMDNWAAVSINEHDFGNTHLVRLQIHLKDQAKPVRAGMRPLNPFQKQDLDRQLDEWKKSKVIEESASAWSSALVPCKKKGSDKLRWALDFRKLNDLTVKDAYPLPNIEGNIMQLAGSKYFSALDSSGAFHCVPIDEEYRNLTAFNTHRGQFRFVSMPFGLCNAPSTYARLVQIALDRLPPGFALGYLDDIIVHSATLAEHIDHLRQVVELHVACGMKLNLKKCQLVREECQYLGHMVSSHGVRMVPDYVARILDWKLPQTGKELRSFLGFVGYYRSFIKEFSALTAEMNKMKCSKDRKLEWKEETIRDFEQLKQQFAAEPTRGYPDFTSQSPFILDTDWSQKAMAAVLSQEQGGQEVFLGCAAKKCNPAERNYPSHKGELAAVILGLKKFEHILRAKPFVIRSDSKCVQYLQTTKEFRGIYARWHCFLASFDFTLVHRPGTLQTNADTISRREDIMEEAEVNPVEDMEPYGDVEDIYSVTVKEITEDNIRQATNNDHIMFRIKEYVMKECKPSKEERKTLELEGMQYTNVFECLSVSNGILYYQSPTVNGLPSKRRMCLPPAMRELAFTMAHADPAGISGHYGQNQTFDRMKERFYWPGMYTFVSARVKNCVPCITKKTTPDKQAHKLHRELLSYFGQKVYSDIVCGLPPATFENKLCRYLLTIQDGFTRYLVAIPIPDMESKTIATAIIQHWIYRYGVFETLHTDRGANFTSKLFTEVMKGLGITKTVTPSYSPEGDRVERAHRVLGDILRADRRTDASHWTDKIQAATLAYNVAVNRVTGVSPYEAVFGKPMTLPIDLVFPFERPATKSWSTHLADLQLKIPQLTRAICEHQRTCIARSNSNFQARSRPALTVGDSVYYFMARVQRGLHRKLQSHWIGPFEVKRIVSESLVVIYPCGQWCTNPREIAAIVNRLRRVEPDFRPVSINPQNRVNLDIIDDQRDLFAEQLHFQSEFESNNNLPTIQAQPALFPSVPTAVISSEKEGENAREQSRFENSNLAQKRLKEESCGEAEREATPSPSFEAEEREEERERETAEEGESYTELTTEERAHSRDEDEKGKGEGEREERVRRRAFSLARDKMFAEWIS